MLMQGEIVRISIKNHNKYKETGFVGLPKIEVSEAEINFSGVADDYNHYRATRKNNSPDRAVLLMTTDMLKQLQSEGWPLKPGDLGENLSVKDIPYEFFEVGKKFNVGEVKLEITEKCNPCNNLSALQYVGDEKVMEFIKILKNRRGWYAKVLKEGLVKKNDRITHFE